MNPITRFASTMLVCGLPLTLAAQYHLIPGPAGKDGCSGEKPARICLGAAGEAQCYAPPNDKDFVFGLDPKATPAGTLDGIPLTLFEATFSGCGSGTLTHYSLLTVRNGEFVDLLPKVELTNISEIRLWKLPALSALPVVVTADFIWDFKAGETHFDNHRYKIDAFLYDAATGMYLQKLDYETAKKYSSGDGLPIQTLEAERTTILARLKAPIH
jgi:hypothetical protein